MKEYYIYTVDGNKMVGRVYANHWVDARLAGCEAFGYRFNEIFAAEKPLPVV